MEQLKSTDPIFDTADDIMCIDDDYQIDETGSNEAHIVSIELMVQPTQQQSTVDTGERMYSG